MLVLRRRSRKCFKVLKASLISCLAQHAAMTHSFSCDLQGLGPIAITTPFAGMPIASSIFVARADSSIAIDTNESKSCLEDLTTRQSSNELSTRLLPSLFSLLSGRIVKTRIFYLKIPTPCRVLNFVLWQKVELGRYSILTCAIHRRRVARCYLNTLRACTCI